MLPISSCRCADGAAPPLGFESTDGDAHEARRRRITPG
jgi:hypothetical protein